MTDLKYNKKAEKFINKHGKVTSVQVSGFRVMRIVTSESKEVKLNFFQSVYLGLINESINFIKKIKGYYIMKQFDKKELKHDH